MEFLRQFENSGGFGSEILLTLSIDSSQSSSVELSSSPATTNKIQNIKSKIHARMNVI